MSEHCAFKGLQVLNKCWITICPPPSKFLELPTDSKEAPLLCQRGGLHALNGRTNERTGGRVVGWGCLPVDSAQTEKYVPDYSLSWLVECAV